MKPMLRAALVALPLFMGGCADNPYPYQVEGDTAMQTMRYDDAVAAYSRSLELNPGDPHVRAQLGRAYMKAGRPLEASEQFRIAVSQQLGNDACLDELCDALLAAGKHDDLYGLLRTNCADRGSVGDFIRMGRYSHRMGDGDTARTSLLAAARIDGGKTVGPQIALYDFYAAIGDRASASRRLRMAYFIDPKSTDVVSRIQQSGEIPGPTFGLVPSDSQ